MPMAKVQVVVKEPQVEGPPAAAEVPISETIHKLLLAGVGAIFVTQEALADLFARLVEEGEIAQQEGKKLVSEQMRGSRHQVRKVLSRGKEQAGDAEAELRAQMEVALGRLNVPTKGDIDALSAKVSELTAKLDTLKNQ